MPPVKPNKCRLLVPWHSVFLEQMPDIQLIIKFSNVILMLHLGQLPFMQQSPEMFITNTIEQNPLNANSSSASQVNLRILRNPEVPYRVHKNPPLFPVLSHINPFQALATDLLSSHLRQGLPNGLFSFKFPHQNPLFSPQCYIIRPSRRLLYSQIILKWMRGCNCHSHIGIQTWYRTKSELTVLR